MTLTEKSGHQAWCALVALALTRQDSGVLSPAQEDLFLTRFLATAVKQRRFSHDVTPDIEWLLKQGRQLGVGAKLVSKLDYLWRSCTGELSEQNELFRLVCRCTKCRSERRLSLTNQPRCRFGRQRSADKSADGTSEGERGGGGDEADESLWLAGGASAGYLPAPPV